MLLFQLEFVKHACTRARAHKDKKIELKSFFYHDNTMAKNCYLQYYTLNCTLCWCALCWNLHQTRSISSSKPPDIQYTCIRNSLCSFATAILCSKTQCEAFEHEYNQPKIRKFNTECIERWIKFWVIGFIIFKWLHTTLHQ